MATKIRFEKKECSRCGGCGRFSFNYHDGDKCYGCSGTGRQLTPAGKRAFKAYEETRDELTRVLASDVKVGERVFVPGMRKLVTITESCPDTFNGNGRWILAYETRSGTCSHGFYATCTVRYPLNGANFDAVCDRMRRFKGAEVIEE